MTSHSNTLSKALHDEVLMCAEQKKIKGRGDMEGEVAFCLKVPKGAEKKENKKYVATEGSHE
jgi:hypothetical protein